MKRHYCVHCERKIYESKMKLVKLPYLLAKYVWVCNVCFSRLSDRAKVVEQ